MYSPGVWPVMRLLAGLVFLVASIVAVTILLAVLVGSDANAAEPCQGNTEIKCTKMHGAKAGCAVPCTGLLGPEALIRAGAKCIAPDGQLVGCNKKLELEKQARDADKIKFESDLRIEKERGDKCCEIAMKPCPPKMELEWHERPEFVAPISVVATGIVIGLLVAVLYETGAVKP